LSRSTGGSKQTQNRKRKLQQEVSMAVTLSERAASHVANYMVKRGKGIGLRLGVRTSGCSGMAYKLEFADSAQPDDVEFESHGVRVLVDPKSMPYLDGTELGLRARGSQRRLQVQQPERQGRLRLRRELQRLTMAGRIQHSFSIQHDRGFFSRSRSPGSTHLARAGRRPLTKTHGLQHRSFLAVRAAGRLPPGR
jgi:iron-sulfur cluster assembly protein